MNADEMGSVPSPRWRVAFGLTLLAAMGVATFITFILGVLAPFLLEEFGISRSQLGALTTVLYVVGGLGSPAAGHVVDRFGGRVTLMVLFLSGAIGTVGVAVARNYAWLVVAMVLAGFSLAAGNPVTNKLVAEHLPIGTRGTIMGVKQAGVPLGAFLAGVVIPGTALLLGWRGAVLIALVVPVAGLVAGQRLVPPDAVTARPRHRQPRHRLGPNVRWLAWYAFFMGAGVAVVNVYLPLYAYDRVGLGVAAAGLVTSVIGFVGVLSRVGWGRLTERSGRVTMPLMAIAACSMGSVLLILAAETAGSWLLWGAALLFGSSTLGWIVVGMIGVVAEIGRERAGRASGVVLLGFYGGFIPSPVIFGAIVDHRGGYRLAWMVIAAVFLVATSIAIAWHRGSDRESSPPGRGAGMRRPAV